MHRALVTLLGLPCWHCAQHSTAAMHCAVYSRQAILLQGLVPTKPHKTQCNAVQTAQMAPSSKHARCRTSREVQAEAPTGGCHTYMQALDKSACFMPSARVLLLLYTHRCADCFADAWNR
jgi:hypothetical protein